MMLKVKDPNVIVIEKDDKDANCTIDANNIESNLTERLHSKLKLNYYKEASKTSALFKMAILASLLASTLLASLIIFYPNDANQVNGMKFKRVCFIGMDLPPFSSKKIGPTRRDANVDANNIARDANLNISSSVDNISMKFNVFDEKGVPIFNPKYCTHIIIIPASFDKDANVFPRTPNDTLKYKEINSLRTFNPEIKILISICGSNDDWNEISSTNETRLKFANNLNNFINIHSFDGVDFDWEFPVYSSYKWRERFNFISLLRTVRQVIDGGTSTDATLVDDAKVIRDVNGDANKKKKKILTIDVPGDVTIILPGYDVISINSIVDWINVMTYDLMMYKPLYPFTGFNGALFPKSSQRYYFATLNVASAAYLWNHLGMEKDKIIIGVPTYARSYVLYDKSMNYVGAPATSAGNVYSFGDVCSILNMNGTVRIFDDEAKVPYAVQEDLWITYEDAESAKEKAKFIRDNKFGGSMLFALNYDDYDGRCSLKGEDGVDSDHKFVIQKALYDGLK